ncbi:hypothetical protein BH10ACI2_BH10ACI2_05390 [soil metagenome]
MKELSLNNCRLDRRYDVREQLGRGSYAEVFLARDTLASPQSPHGDVVIKALNVFLQDDLDADLERTLVENFQNEAIALDRVRHPNIISRIGHGTAKDLRGTVFHYLVLEYLSGGDLAGLMRRQKISLGQALNYIEQICAGLGHAHKYSIIHRDIKPQNILLTADLSTVKIAEFGVARISTADSPITRVGTNIYAPPEHSPMSAGQTGTLAFAKLTPSADIYSLAKTVYTLLTGEAPRAFANETITDLPEACRNEEWATELLRVLKRATNADPRQRHQTVEEFWSDMLAIREIAADGEFSTVLAAAAGSPQPHVSRGYTPIAPELPRFEPISEKPFKKAPALAFDPSGAVIPTYTPIIPVVSETPIADRSVLKPIVPVKRKRRAIRRFAAFMVFICLFTGILYGTASFMRGRNFLPEIRNPFRAQQTGVANTDIYLRPSPNTDNDPIGLVTKNSKVRIVSSQNNWYQVDVVEQGRDRPNQPNATRGWLNGKYVEISDN